MTILVKKKQIGDKIIWDRVGGYIWYLKPRMESALNVIHTELKKIGKDLYITEMSVDVALMTPYEISQTANTVKITASISVDRVKELVGKEFQVDKENGNITIKHIT